MKRRWNGVGVRESKRLFLENCLKIEILDRQHLNLSVDFIQDKFLNEFFTFQRTQKTSAAAERSSNCCAASVGNQMFSVIQVMKMPPVKAEATSLSHTTYKL
jgi:hypothetical protein